ncbi:MAG: NTP transferase domain-containing protein, partial [Candidatus Glassbacteria bacterium]
MKALMIAAGRGSGFNGLGPRSHKTLTPVWGLAVIERIIAAIPGLDELVVVTGFRREKLEADLTRLIGSRLRLKFVFNPQWERANGVSVLAAREVLAGEERFLLTMSDHVFEPALAERLLACPPRRGECVLAVDRNLGGVFDLPDATKVKLSADGRIGQIGKNLKNYDAADTGVFYCTPALFQALETTVSAGGESLSDGIRVLCEAGRMRWADVTGCMWQDVDNLESLAEAKRRVWQSSQKPRDGVVSRLLNRKVSGFITRLLAGLPVRPNHVTLFNLFLA